MHRIVPRPIKKPHVDGGTKYRHRYAAILVAELPHTARAYIATT